MNTITNILLATLQLGLAAIAASFTVLAVVFFGKAAQRILKDQKSFCSLLA